MSSVRRLPRSSTRHLLRSGQRVATTSASRWNSSTSNSATNGTQELGVGELQGAKFKIEPLRRTGEDAATMRARLLYQSRKRGTLESDLLLSTFAASHLSAMSPAQLAEYDQFLDENDWDIYYWATQEAPSSLGSTGEGAGADTLAAGLQNSEPWMAPSPRPGEWAQTVGTFKPAYRPVPARWKDSEILALLRRHVQERSVSKDGKGGGGMGFMPPLSWGGSKQR